MKDFTEFPNLIIINPFGRGGSGFFQSLFDGLPAVGVIDGCDDPLAINYNSLVIIIYNNLEFLSCQSNFEF